MAKTLIGIYDLRYSPVTFDFLTFLVLMESYRKLKGFNDIHLVVRAREGRVKSDREKVMSVVERGWRLNNIIVGSIRLLRSVMSYEVSVREGELNLADRRNVFPPNYPFEGPNSNYITPYYPRPLHEWVKKTGEDPRCLQATPYAKSRVDEFLRGRTPVVLAPRVSRFFKTRNADILAWREFYRRLRAAECFPVVVPDQDMCWDSTASGEWLEFSPAALDIDLRAALYERAKWVFCMSNGPSILGIYSKKINVSIFDIINEETTATTAKMLKKSSGLEVGEQYSFSSCSQRLVYEQSSVESLLSEARRSGIL